MSFNPFAKLKILLDGITPPEKIPLHIGNPGGEHDKSLDSLLSSVSGFDSYPAIAPSQTLIDAIKDYYAETQGVTLKDSQVLPVRGTRFPLVLLSHVLQGDAVGMSKLCYQAYPAGTKEFGKTVVFEEPDNLQDVDFRFVNNPHNPLGYQLDDTTLKEIASTGVTTVVDECYIDVYHKSKPSSVLRFGTDNIIVANSLSKSANLPGLRSGVLVGDQKLIKRFSDFYAILGITMSQSDQDASAHAWKNAQFRESTRQRYTKAMSHFAEQYGCELPDSGFCYFLPTQRSGEEVTKSLYAKYGIQVIPGRYLDASNSSEYDNFIRVVVNNALDIKVIEAIQDEASN